MKRIGIIGTGLIAQNHFAAYTAYGHDAQIVALCDIDEQKMLAFAERNRISGASCNRDYKVMFDSGEIDLVSICTSNDVHAEISLYALEKGVHVLCEKPLSMDWKESLKMADAADKAGVRAVTGFTYRNIPAVRLLKELVAQGTFGDIRQIRGTFFADRMASLDMPLEWRHLKERAGTGVIGDLVSHLVDMAIYLLDGHSDPIGRVVATTAIQVPERRCAETGRMVAVTTDEICHVSARTKGGVDMLFDTSRYAPFEMHMHVSGTKGAARFYFDKPLEIEMMLRESVADHFAKYRPVAVPARLIPDDTRHVDRMCMQIKKFLDSIDDASIELPDFRYGAYVQRLLDAMAESALSERPVEI